MTGTKPMLPSNERYEYKVVGVVGGLDLNTLNALGADGWQLVGQRGPFAQDSYPQQTFYTFMRRMTPSETGALLINEADSLPKLVHARATIEMLISRHTQKANEEQP
jgi:hypothetical protein